MTRARLELRNDTAELDRLAVALEEFGIKGRLSPDLIAELNLVIEELITNTFNYGAAEGRDPAEIFAVLEMAYADGEVTLRIEDNGRAFDPLQMEDPDLDVSLEEREIGGLGIHLVKTLMDSIEYSRAGDRNVLVMSKRIVSEGA